MSVFKIDSPGKKKKKLILNTHISIKYLVIMLNF